MNEANLKDSGFRLGIVDEQEEDVNEFFSYFDDYFIPIKIDIGIKVEDAIYDIINKDVDVVAIDYYLKEHNQKILYNGNDLFKELSMQLKGFPCFLMTSYPEEAKKHNIDPFRIFGKTIMQPDPEKKVEYKEGLELVERIQQSVTNYNNEIKEKESRIYELVKVSDERDLTHAEESELIELDTFFERIYDGRNIVPEDLKTISNSKKLSGLLSKVDELIAKVDEEK